jgi:hypothetical protein
MTRNSRFAEAVGRLDRLIAGIKAGQFEATGAGPLLPAPVRLRSGRHPDQEWSRNYAARTIRARGESAPPAPDHAVPQMSEGLRQPGALPPEAAPPVPAGGHIGAALGKPARKRGVLARLFRGADR